MYHCHALRLTVTQSSSAGWADGTGKENRKIEIAVVLKTVNCRNYLGVGN